MSNETPSTHDHEPYGPNGTTISIEAKELLESLDEQDQTTEAQGERKWLEEDGLALESWVEMEWYMTFLEPNEVETEDVIELADHINRLHSAMPFTEAERHWLVHTYRQIHEPHDNPSHLREQELSLVSGGVRQVVQGRDLMRRWHSWRRQTDEFQGQGSLDTLREVLPKISQAVSPGTD